MSSNSPVKTLADAIDDTQSVRRLHDLNQDALMHTVDMIHEESARSLRGMLIVMRSQAQKLNRLEQILKELKKTLDKSQPEDE